MRALPTDNRVSNTRREKAKLQHRGKAVSWIRSLPSTAVDVKDHQHAAATHVIHVAILDYIHVYTDFTDFISSNDHNHYIYTHTLECYTVNTRSITNVLGAQACPTSCSPCSACHYYGI